MLRNCMKKILSLLMGFMLLVPGFAQGFICGGSALAEGKTEQNVHAEATAAGIRISKKNFPDNNFREYILGAGFDRDGNGYLTDAEIEQVTDIDCRNKSIKSLKGIEYFTSLARLDCSVNKLSELNVSRFPELASLSCAENKLTALEVLACYSNKLYSLKLGTKEHLRSLDCHDNRLKKLDVSGCPLIVKLIKNKYKSIDGNTVIYRKGSGVVQLDSTVQITK